MRTKPGQYIPRYIIGLQMMLKLVSLRLETQADMTLHVRQSCSNHGRGDHRLKENGTNRAGRHQISIVNFFYCLVHNY
jgi:hypothetical protein